jgi:hypothetical protein
MSISTPQSGGSRRTPAKKAVAGGKPKLSKDTDGAGTERPAKKTAAAAKAAPAKKGARPAAGRPAAARPAGKGGGRRTIAPMRVSQGRNWGPIILFGAVISLALGIIGFASYKVYETNLTVTDKVEAIDGTVNFRKTDKALVKGGLHQSGVIQYAQKPPVAGKHNGEWQNCLGDVYDAPIANEHAVHSLEHGAVWLTYDPAKVNKQQIDALAAKVRGKEYSMMSPVEGMDKAVSVQAWGFQLKVDNPGDKRIDKFLTATRKNASVEKGATCAGGITEPGTTPRDLQPSAAPQGS